MENKLWVSLFLAALALLLLSPLASAIPQLSVSIENVKPSVLAGAAARYNAVLINDEARPLEVLLTLSGPKADAWVQPYDYSVTVPAGSVLKVPLVIQPLADSATGNYIYTLAVQAKDESGNWIQLSNPPSLIVSVTQPKTDFVELGKIQLSLFDEKETYLPGDVVQVQVQISSLKELFAQLDVKIQLLDSAGRPVYGYTVPMTSQKEPIKPVSHNIPLGVQASPGQYFVVAQLDSDKGQVAIARKSIEIGSVSKTEQRRAVQTGFLSRKISVYVENLGNVPAAGTVVEKISWYDKFLLTANPAPSFVPVAGNAINLVWSYGPLEPSHSSQTFVYSVSYLPVLLGAILLFLLVLVAWQQIKPVSVAKEVLKQRIAQNFLEATLTLHVKNLTEKAVTQVKVTDFVPNLAKPMEYGTASPVHTRKEKLETVLVWDLDELKGGEERVITYKIRTTVGVLGSIDLPSAQMEFVMADGKRRIVRSNTAECGRSV